MTVSNSSVVELTCIGGPESTVASFTNRYRSLGFPLCPIWMNLSVARSLSVSPQAGRPAARMRQLAEAHAQECCVCCLNSGLSHCRSGGDEQRKWLHVYIAELSFSPPWVSNALLFKHSQVREMTPADAGVHSSASALHLNLVFVNSQTVEH